MRCQTYGYLPSRPACAGTKFILLGDGGWQFQVYIQLFKYSSISIIQWCQIIVICPRPISKQTANFADFIFVPGETGEKWIGAIRSSKGDNEIFDGKSKLSDNIHVFSASYWSAVMRRRHHETTYNPRILGSTQTRYWPLTRLTDWLTTQACNRYPARNLKNCRPLTPDSTFHARDISRCSRACHIGGSWTERSFSVLADLQPTLTRVKNW